MRTTRQFRVFLLAAGSLVLASAAWSWLRWRAQAPERSAWAAVQSDLSAQSARIDSIEGVIDRMQGELDAQKRAIRSASERLSHVGRQAVGGRLPQADYRRYLQEIDRHNDAVDAHNVMLSELRRVQEEYSALVDVHNALVDSANELQRLAVQEGIQLAEPKSGYRE
ncbi:MAG TPA: hypothetical protein VFH82_02665 [Gemmatimonadota bacterium]|nr:hypothetical protein [Gemmatimonadota bacterium]